MFKTDIASWTSKIFAATWHFVLLICIKLRVFLNFSLLLSSLNHSEVNILYCMCYRKFSRALVCSSRLSSLSTPCISHGLLWATTPVSLTTRSNVHTNINLFNALSILLIVIDVNIHTCCETTEKSHSWTLSLFRNNRWPDSDSYFMKNC